MQSATTIRMQVESALALKFPSALTPPPRIIRPQSPTGIVALDDLLGGGLPIGAVTELVGAECTGRTSTALSFLAKITAAGKVGAWVDTSNAFDPLSAAATGVALDRLLWVRCGDATPIPGQIRNEFTPAARCLVPPVPKKGLHGGGFGPHPRTEIRGLPEAITGFFSGCRPSARSAPSALEPGPDSQQLSVAEIPAMPPRLRRRARQYDAIERALRSTDLLLQTGGFSAIVLDLAGIPAKYVARIELSTWHRYRVAAEKMQACILLLTQYPCAKSGSELLLRLSSASATTKSSTVFCEMEIEVAILRQRFKPPESNVVPMRKPVQNVRSASWRSRTSWTGTR